MNKIFKSIRLIFPLALGLVTVLYFAGCEKKNKNSHDHGHEEGHKDDHHKEGHDDHQKDGGGHDDHHKEGEGHHHDPLHKAEGASMVALGEHFAHMEMGLDEKSGKLTLWISDGEAGKPIRLKHKEIPMYLKIKGKDKAVKLSAVANKLTGEIVGDTSQFEVQVDQLKGVKEFGGIIPEMVIKGKKFNSTTFKYPLKEEE